MIRPQEIESTAFVPSLQSLVSIKSGEKLYISQRGGHCVVMAYEGDLTINAKQTPINYIQTALTNE